MIVIRNIAATAALLMVMAPACYAAADFPNKPVRMVIPLAPGGGSDIVGRIVAQGLSDHWGKTVVVDNRPGAGSIVGTSLVAKTPGDGYTLLVSSSSFAISPALYKNIDFDARRDFTAVTLLASQPSLLVVNAGVPAKSLPELLALAKTKPGQLAYGSAGVGSANLDALLDWWRAQPLDLSFLPTPVAEYAFAQHLGHPTLRTLLIGGDRLRQFAEAGLIDISRAESFQINSGSPR